MDKRLLIMVNPNAGKGVIRNKLLAIIDSFVKDGWAVSVHITQGTNDAFEFIKNNADKFDRIVVSGGDGTINQAICGLMTIDKEKRPEVGYIPAGTVNDFASSIQIPKNIMNATNTVLKGNPFKCDIGAFNDKNFVYVAACGAFTNVSYETPQVNKNILGQLAYFLEGIKQLHALPSHKMKIETENDTFEGEFLLGMISNSNHIAGIKTGKAFKAQLNDGLFEVFFVRSPKTLMEMSDLSWHLLKQDLNTDAIKLFRTDKIKITSNQPVQWTLDGEFGGSVNEAQICVQKEAVTLLV